MKQIVDAEKDLYRLNEETKVLGRGFILLVFT